MQCLIAELFIFALLPTTLRQRLVISEVLLTVCSSSWRDVN